jgi:hypothetical protein
MRERVRTYPHRHGGLEHSEAARLKIPIATAIIEAVLNPSQG